MAKKARRSTSEEKLAAVRMLQSGENVDKVAGVFEVSRAIVYRWLQKYNEDGDAGLEIREAPGRPPSLTPEQRAKIFALIEGSNPRQMQLDFGELWTRKNVQAMIRLEFGVELSIVQVGRVLHDIGLSPQKPLYRAYRQKPELVEEWKKVIYPKIRNRAAVEGAVILFGDEASVNVQVLGLAAAVRDGRLRFGGGRGVAVAAERGFGDDPGL
jgi:transposase